MEYNIKSLEGLEREISLSIPQTKVASIIDSKLSNLAKKAKISGFRPGKVPKSVLTKHYGEEVQREAVNEAINQAMGNVVREIDTQIAALPVITNIQQPANDKLEVTATFEVLPTVELADFTKLTLKKVQAAIVDADVDAMITKLQEQESTWHEIAEPAATEMKVEVDFVGTIDGIAFDGGTGQDMPFVIGSKSMLEEFEQGVVGLKAGDDTKVPVTFPKAYHAKHLAGKTAEFAISVKKVMNRKLAVLDEAFVKKYGQAQMDVPAFKQKIRQNLIHELEQRQQDLFREELFQALLKAHEVELPKVMVQEEIKRQREALSAQMQQYNQSIDVGEYPDEHFSDKARDNVKLSLLLRTYVDKNKVTADKQAIDQRIKGIAATYADPAAVEKWLHEDKEQMDKLRSHVMEDLVVEKIAKDAKVELEDVSYTEIMARSSQ